MSLSSFAFQPIGTVQSSRKEAIDDVWDHETARIELDPSRFTEEALTGLAEFSHVEVLFYLDQVSDSERHFGARHPRGDNTYSKVGVFAQRGKNRPNPIGLTVCRVLSVRGTTLELSGLDAIDGTPVLDLKPWVSAFGPRGKVAEPAWIGRLMRDYWSQEEGSSADERVLTAIQQRSERNLSAALELLAAALADQPNDPMIHYQIAWTHDALGKESDAVAPYQKALDLGLSGPSRVGLFVGYSSTLRCLGRYEEALKIIDQACNEFPDSNVFRVFQALILNNLNRGDETITSLLTVLLDTTGDQEVRRYDRALRFYSTRLRERFE